jgi:hypothetical protein
MAWKQSDYERNQAKHPGVGALPVVQKLQDADTGVPDNKARLPAVDATCNATYHVAITLRISDKRDRDNDGAVSTLFDVLVSAIGRLSEMDRVAFRKYAASLKRAGRVRSRNQPS